MSVCCCSIESRSDVTIDAPPSAVGAAQRRDVPGDRDRAPGSLRAMAAIRNDPLDDRSIVLTGFMGTGKTTVGRRLAERLGFGFVDTDDMIEERHGSIPAIFAERGEAAFRRFEHEAAVELAGRNRLVIATGGRLMLDPANAEILSRVARVVCLHADVDSILQRVGDDDLGSRPLLAAGDPRQRVTELLAERAVAYGRFPAVTTDGRSPGEVVDVIVELVGARANPDGQSTMVSPPDTLNT